MHFYKLRYRLDDPILFGCFGVYMLFQLEAIQKNRRGQEFCLDYNIPTSTEMNYVYERSAWL
jgi:hypothetical protein